MPIVEVAPIYPQRVLVRGPDLSVALKFKHKPRIVGGQTLEVRGVR